LWPWSSSLPWRMSGHPKVGEHTYLLHPVLERWNNGKKT
jgi:hypothetical protein